MTAEALFLFANSFALVGWTVLVYAVIRKRDWIRDRVAGFDLFVGSWIARETMTRGLHRLWLVLFLPATFLFGPIGLLFYSLIAFRPVSSERTR